MRPEIQDPCVYCLEIHLGDFDYHYSSSSYAECIDRARSLLPFCEVGHDGDISDFGDRTLVWPTQEDAIEDECFKHFCGFIQRVSA